MRIARCSGVALFLALLGGAAAGSPQPAPPEQASPETVAKLIAQLGSADFRTRQQATDKLEKFGAPVLPALRKALTVNRELEVKRRLESVVSRIEQALLQVEEKHWQGFDAPRRDIKERLKRILARTPTLSDRQVASACYLLTLGRPPTDEEVKRAEKQFAGINERRVTALQLARPLVQDNGFNAAIGAASGRLLKTQKDLAANAMDVAKSLHRLNGAEFQNLIRDVAASVTKSVKGDEPFVDLAFLLVLSRYPKANESTQAGAHLKRAQNRATASENIFWALMNTKEFIMKP